MNRTVKLILRQCWLIVSMVIMLGGQAMADDGALGADQRNALRSGIYYFNVDEGNGCNVGVSVGKGTLPSIIPEPYNGSFTAAGAAYNVSPLLIAALFTQEHFTNQPITSIAGSWAALPKAQPDPNSGWATSPDQAKGPFQFIPATWTSLGVDADHNGVKDVENLLDASFGAANYAKTDGATADKPESVWHDFADGYSGHTGGYADHFMSYVDYYKTGSTGAAGDGSNTISTSNNGCDDGAGGIAGNLVQTAINLAWDDYPTHNFSSKDPKPAYLAAKNAVHGPGDNVPDQLALTDCGVFIATVVYSANVDPNWPKLTSYVMRQYAQTHPDKWQTFPSFKSSADLQPGDILVNSDHIYMYVGKQADGKSVAEASHFDHVPEVDADPYPSQNGENFTVVRLKS